MSATLSAGIVRIFNPQMAVEGAGFLISQRYILTRVHVIHQARREPSQLINLDFPLVAPRKLLWGKIMLLISNTDGANRIYGLDIPGYFTCARRVAPPTIPSASGVRTTQNLYGGWSKDV